MAMTLRLSPSEDETLARLARTFNSSKNSAVAVAIDLATPKLEHSEFVLARTARLMDRYSVLLRRLAEA